MLCQNSPAGGLRLSAKRYLQLVGKKRKFKMIKGHWQE
jgi:hypothetical protein